MTIIGNVLVILAVFNYRPLKKVQNYFLVSLAASGRNLSNFKKTACIRYIRWFVCYAASRRQIFSW